MKAKISVKELRSSGKQKVVVTDVNINGIITKRTFVVPEKASQLEIQDQIVKEIRNSRVKPVIPDFEVEI